MRKFLIILTACLFSGGLRASSFPSDGDAWTESSSYESNWTYVEYGGHVYYVSDGDAQVGQTYVKTCTWSYNYDASHFGNPHWPCAYYSFPNGPLDMSNSSTVISFWLRPDISATTATSPVPNTSVNMEIRLYTDSTGVYGNSYVMRQLNYLPSKKWQHYVLSAADFPNHYASWNMSHVYGIVFLGAYVQGDLSISVDALSVSNDFPTFVIQSPTPASDNLFTMPGGIDSIQLKWNMPVTFNTIGSVTVKDSSNNLVTCYAFGSGSDLMRISFDAPLFNNRYTLTVSDSVASVATGKAIDGDNNGTSGGNATFSFEHRRREDINRDGQVNMKDVGLFAGQWLQQF